MSARTKKKCRQTGVFRHAEMGNFWCPTPPPPGFPSPTSPHRTYTRVLEAEQSTMQLEYFSYSPITWNTPCYAHLYLYLESRLWSSGKSGQVHATFFPRGALITFGAGDTRDGHRRATASSSPFRQCRSHIAHTNK